MDPLSIIVRCACCFDKLESSWCDDYPGIDAMMEVEPCKNCLKLAGKPAPEKPS